jgi:hypothetical protein
MKTTDERLRRSVDPRLEPGETFVAWTRAWVSRYQKFHWLLSLRRRDFAVVTDRRLMLWSAGFYSRRPRRRVLAERLDEVTVKSTSRDPGRRMACSRAGRKPLLLELGKDPQSDRFSIELRDRADAATRAAREAANNPPAARPYFDFDPAPSVVADPSVFVAAPPEPANPPEPAPPDATTTNVPDDAPVGPAADPPNLRPWP